VRGNHGGLLKTNSTGGWGKGGGKSRRTLWVGVLCGAETDGWPSERKVVKTLQEEEGITARERKVLIEQTLKKKGKKKAELLRKDLRQLKLVCGGERILAERTSEEEKEINRGSWGKKSKKKRKTGIYF